MKIINSSNRKWWTLATVCFALFMIVLDGNVVALAIPRILKDFNASISQVEWILNAYLLTFAVLLITFGRLGDMMGRKFMFILGIVVFVTGSFLCGHADSMTQLIIYRIIQGVGGAAMMPATISLISANFSQKERGTAMGLWGAVSGLAIVAGPIIGGYLTDKGLGAHINDLLNISQNWRYIFYINLPFGLLALIMTLLVIQESRDLYNRHRIDFLGILLSALTIFPLTFAFIEGQKYGWWHTNQDLILFSHKIAPFSHSIIPWLFGVSLLFGIIFILLERRKSDPMLDVKLFKIRNYSVGNLATTILSFAMLGSFFLLPLYLQGILGFSAIKSGETLLPLAISIMIAAPISGKLSDRIGAKWIIFLGMIIIAIGLFYIGHLKVDTTIKQLVLPFIIVGIGMGMSLAPSSALTLLDIPESEYGGASGIFGTTRQIGSVMGIAILGAFLQSFMFTDIGKQIDTISGLPENVKNSIIHTVQQSSTGYGSNIDYESELKKALQNPSNSSNSQSKVKTSNIFSFLGNLISKAYALQSQGQIQNSNCITQIQTLNGMSQSQTLCFPTSEPIKTATPNPKPSIEQKPVGKIIPKSKKMTNPLVNNNLKGTSGISQPQITPTPSNTPIVSQNQSVINNQELAMLGTEIQTKVKQGFVDSINKTIQYASLFAIAGAIVALFFKNRRVENESISVQERRESIPTQEMTRL